MASKDLEVVSSFCLFLSMWMCLFSQESLSVCTDTGVRLQPSDSYLRGPVQILIGSVGLPLCGDNWGVNEAMVVCRELGFNTEGVEASTEPPVSSTDGAAVFEVQCTGNEASISECNVKVNAQICSRIAAVTCVEDDVVLLQKGRRVANNSIININSEDISTNALANSPLICKTTRDPCCLSPNFTTAGWYYPDNMQIPDISAQFNFYTLRETDMTIRLSYQNSSRSINLMPGMYYCEVPDENDTLQQLFVGIYPQDEGHVVVSDLLYDENTQTVICISTGGPATSVEWIKDNTTLDINELQHYEESQVIVDTVNATFENKLRITKLTKYTSGTYSCLVSNALGNYSAELSVQVYFNGDTRLVGSENAAIEIYFDGGWHSVCTNLHIEIDPENSPERNIELQMNSTSLIISWERLNSETESQVSAYRVSCSAAVMLHQVALSVTDTVAEINGLYPSTSYNCCVTAYQDRGTFLQFSTTACRSVTFNVSSQGKGGEQSQYFIAVIALSVNTGLLTMLVVAVCAISLGVATKKKLRKRKKIILQPEYRSHEVLLRNPIYNVNPQNDLEYSTIDARREPTNHTIKESIRYSTHLETQNVTEERSEQPWPYEIVDMTKDVNTVHVFENTQQSNAPMYSLIESADDHSQSVTNVKPYEVVDLVGSVKSEHSVLLDSNVNTSDELTESDNVHYPLAMPYETVVPVGSSYSPANSRNDSYTSQTNDVQHTSEYLPRPYEEVSPSQDSTNNEE